MSRENPKKYPRSVESKNSFLRIRAPEHLDIALEGLIRKVLKEQPKMDDIYSFAADYFDMLLKIREKAGIRKLSPQDICPHHNEDDAHEMIKLASSFTKRAKEPKPHSNSYKVLTLRNEDQNRRRKRSEKVESKDLPVIMPQNEGPGSEEILQTGKDKSEGDLVKNEENKSDVKDSEIDYSVKVSGQEVGEEVFIKANEVVAEYSVEEEDSQGGLLENEVEPVGDINELKDKIKAVENEIQLLDKKEYKTQVETVENGADGENLEDGEPGGEEEKSREDKVEDDTEEIKESQVSLNENSGEAKQNEVAAEEEESQEAEVTAGNLEPQEIKSNEELVDEPQDVTENTENAAESENSKSDTEIGTEKMQAETQEAEGNRDVPPEEVEERKTNAESAGEDMHSEAEGKPDSDGVDEMKEAAGDETSEVPTEKVEETIEPKSTLEPNSEEPVENDAARAKEMEIMGNENVKTEEGKDNESFIKNEKESVEDERFEITTEADPADGVKEDEPSRAEDSQDQEEDANAEEGTADETKASEEIAVAVPVLSESSLLESESNIKNEDNGTSSLPSGEEGVLGDVFEKPEASVASEVEQFLLSEREHSSLDKESQMDEVKKAPSEEQDSAEINGQTPVETEIIGQTVPVSDTAEGDGGTVENSGKIIESKEEETINTADAEADDDQERDVSTTSDEMEFEVSPDKRPETENVISAEEAAAVEKDSSESRGDVRVESEIVIEINGSSEDGTNEEKKKEEEEEEGPNKGFLEVPGPVLDEYDLKKTSDKEPVVEEPEESELVLDCSNIGNEIIQTGEVEKVELVEGEEDILQVHLTTTIETEPNEGDSVQVEMTSRIEPNFKVSVETRVESPVQDAGNLEKMKLIRAAIAIQNGFRRFKSRKISGELKQEDKKLSNEDASQVASEFKTDTPVQAVDEGNNSPSTISSSERNEKQTKERIFSRSATRTLLETHSLEPVRKISPLKTRSLSSVRYGVADFEVWNQLVQELDGAATKIQSNYRGYKTRKKLQRENAIQSTTTTSEDSASVADLPELNQRHTGEFHDTVVLPLDPK